MKSKDSPGAGQSPGQGIDRLLAAAIVLLAGALVWVVAGTMDVHVTNAGDQAPDFKIVGDDGRTYTRADFGGKLLVLNFWATWCPPCIEELPSLNAFQRRFANSGVVVLGISVDKDEKLYRDFLAKARVSVLTARDPENKINADYGTFKCPETYIIDASGKVVRKIISNTDWMSERMLKDVESLL